MARLLWTQRQDIGPAARLGYGLVYDADHTLTYLFGGRSERAEPVLTDTWAWDGQYWTQVSRFGPGTPSGHAMAFDAARRRTVLFGGALATGAQTQDTWLFDGDDWTQADDIGPTSRSLHALAYDSTRQRVVLFGGLHATTVLDDTWEWDGSGWTQIAQNGPARFAHQMAYDVFRKTVVMFGGYIKGDGGSYQLTGDTWEWDGAAAEWTKVATTGPGPRSSAAMTSTGGVVVLHGGHADGSAGDTWQWVSGTWSKIQEFGPSRRAYHMLAYDSGRNRLVLFGGGRDASGSGDAFAYLGDTWEAVAPLGGGGPTGVVAGNLAVDPTTFSLSGADTGITIAFDIPAQATTTQYSVFLLAGQSVGMGSSTIPAATTRASLHIPRHQVESCLALLGRAHPGTVGITVDLGNVSVPLQIAA